MRPAKRRSIRPRYLVALAATLAIAIVLSLLVGRLGGSGEGITPEALQRIEAKNRNAATAAAALQRAQSQATAEAADREAALRDSGNNAAPLTRFEASNGSADAH